MMDTPAFITWLKGFAEGCTDAPTTEQWQLVRKNLESLESLGAISHDLLEAREMLRGPDESIHPISGISAPFMRNA